MELNIIELTLTSPKSIELNLTEIIAVYNLVAMVTMEHINNPTIKQSQTIAVQGKNHAPN
jgi:hypothetical protein